MGVSNKNHINVRKTHCPKGHAYDENNTAYSKNSNGSVSRKCKTCVSLRAQRHYDEVVRKRLGYNKTERIKDPIIHKTWAGMLDRCRNESSPSYALYGARGIKVCDRWKRYNNFYDDMISTYEKGLTLDRKDNDGNYEPLNCRWATPKEQANNTRRNHMITYLGKTKTLQQWSEEVGIQSATIRHRLKKKWDVQSALNTPVKGIL